jgi:hypothetical protein
MEVVRRSRDPEAEARTQAAVDGLLSLLGDSEEFAAQFDEAVARGDKGLVLDLIAKAGKPDDIEVTIEQLDADRFIELRYCWGPFNWYCIGVRYTW